MKVTAQMMAGVNKDARGEVNKHGHARTTTNDTIFSANGNREKSARDTVDAEARVPEPCSPTSRSTHATTESFFLFLGGD